MHFIVTFFAIFGWVHAQSLIRLDQVMEQDLLGIKVEEKLKGPFKEQRKQALDFALFRSGKLGSKAKIKWLERCAQAAEWSVFCDFLVEPKVMAVMVEDHRPKDVWGSMDQWDLLEPAKKEPTESHYEVAKKIVALDLKGLKGVTEARVLRALKLVRNWSEISQTAETLIQQKSCPPTGLLTGFGLKTEEYFPDLKFRELNRKFYERASVCDSEPEAAKKAAYRLALIRIWDDRFDLALPILHGLTSQENPDQITRLKYWKAYCAIKQGQIQEAQEIRDQMINEFPLSFHSILLSENRKLRGIQLLDRPEPVVIFRSRTQTELNAYVQAAEALIEVGKSTKIRTDEWVQEILNVLSEKSTSAEPEFRLYLAYLVSKGKNPIAVFKILSQIFKDKSDFITKSALKLFYPIKYADTLKAQRDRVDFFLLAALIRQESGFNPLAQSPVGALGLMQLMPPTARKYERVSRRELLDGKSNIRIGAKFLRDLLSKYKGDAELALAAYNAGPEKVDEWLRRYPMKNRLLFFDFIPYRETRDYVTLIARNYYWYLHLYGAIPETLLSEGHLDDPKLKALHWVKPKTRHSLLFTFFSSDSNSDSKAKVKADD